LTDLFLAADTAYDQGDLELAFNLFSQAANKGDDSAMSRLSIMYSEGEGVLRNIDQSIYWDLKAIAAGSVVSLNNLAITYRTDGDIEESKKWFEKAIEAGDGDAALELAKTYLTYENNKLQALSYLQKVIVSDDTCEDSVEEANYLINELGKMT